MRITFLGGGNMAAALIGGLIERGFAASDLQAIDLNADARKGLETRFGVRTADRVDAQALACDVLVLAVKPQSMRKALAPIAGQLTTQLVLSIAAGIRVDALVRWLGGYRRIVRAMPNTPALVGAGAAGLFADTSVTADERDAAARILGAVGSVAWLNSEPQVDAVTALSGSGPAYVFYFIEALIEGGEAIGLSREVARALAIDTVLGAAKLAAASEDDAATLRARVTSKGGTTAAALASMEQDDFKGLIARALAAADARGRELGDELGRD
ncbi:pyrroline-5-carboxylate reductase [Niveibacterium sp. COAC-50]|uniref:pyrroline-5-carboxylate reductase n=1 Tax=Niveibacterium sp. COAC-50 TaxID=2729384 RepID=UPI001554ED66|nr:pyrroline-5-carboxylate reductase [Niveibacterium sp. COAC-50]